MQASRSVHLRPLLIGSEFAFFRLRALAIVVGTPIHFSKMWEDPV